MANPKVMVKEVFANGDQRCEARWPSGAEGVVSPVKDWRQVRDIDFQIDSVTGEAVLSFTRNNATRRSRSKKRGPAREGTGPRRWDEAGRSYAERSRAGK